MIILIHSKTTVGDNPDDNSDDNSDDNLNDNPNASTHIYF
jgi:hypothetical protein